MQFPGNLINKTWKKKKKKKKEKGPILAHLAQFWVTNFFASFTSTTS